MIEKYNPFTLQNKMILVTGASSGIGRSIAIECSKMGATLVITARNEERLKEVLSKLSGESHRYIVADLNSQEDVENIVAQLPKLNGFVSCAGIVEPTPFQFCNKTKVDKMMSINLISPTVLAHKIIKKKKIEKGGSIVFISSVSGVFCSSVGGALYSASKSALVGLSKGMALDMAPQKIRVNCISPAMIETDILKDGTITKEQLSEDMKKYPLKRYGMPEEVAYATIYLLSDATQWITGSNLLIDGGYTAL